MGCAEKPGGGFAAPRLREELSGCADGLLVRAVRELPIAPDQWLGEWEFWLNKEVFTHQTSGPDLLDQASQMVDLLTDELAARNAVLGRESGLLQLAVGGIRSPADYGSLLNYLRSLEFVDAVVVSRLQGDRLWINLQTRADAKQLGDLFEADQPEYDSQIELGDRGTAYTHHQYDGAQVHIGAPRH